MRRGNLTNDTISLVIPLYNESGLIEELLTRLNAVISAEPQSEWDLILVDDGSTDATVEQVERYANRFQAPIRLIQFSRNFGHQPALVAGITAAHGDAVVCLDADLQDPPEMIHQLLEKFREGFEIVYAVRQIRLENFAKRWAYKGFYRLFRRAAEIPIPLDAGDFGLMSKRAASLVVSMPERDVFVRGLRSWVGFKQVGILTTGRRAERGQQNITSVSSSSWRQAHFLDFLFCLCASQLR